MERENEARRPDPDDLLAEVKAENRGRLTIFLGAAAGVGKTYAMLEAAHERQADGVDVVIGWVETHGRQETEALVKGLPIIPSRELVYRDKVFRELDLDALLQRRPQLALVDELAHTNVPGSRHIRRYQDVEELLAAGINVYTTLNIQHVESLNDIIAQITGIRVQETVPDRLLEEADQVQLIDIPPEELIERLKEGKVYVPPQAERALQKFFRPGNLNALREMALRYTAMRVEGQLDHYMRLHGIAGPWPAGERVMACVSPSPFSAQVIRTARRMAAGLKAEWLAVYVETPGCPPADEAERDQLARNLHLAEELGAEVVSLSSDDAAEELLALARRKNVTQIVIGKPLHPRWQEMWRGALVDKIIRNSEGISVHIIPGKTGPRQEQRPAARHYQPGPASWPYAGAVAAVMMVTVLNKILQPFFDLTNIALLYLLPVLFSAVGLGRGPSILTSVLGVLAFDFFFVPPVLSFTVFDLRYLLSFGVFLVVAVITGTLATRLKTQAENARRRETRTAALYALSRKMAAAADMEGLLKAVVETVAETIDGEAVIFMPDAAGGLVVRATSPSPPAKWLDNNECAVARWVFTHGQFAGRGTDTLAGAEGLYLPLRTDNNNLAVLGVKLKYPERRLGPEQRRLLEAFANLAALAILRLQLAVEAQQARCLAASEKLRTALFNSISHDLRTPLASITAAVTGLLEGEEVYHPEARQALLQTIKEGARRLNRLVGNLLDMARLESGMIQLKQEWCDLEDIIGVALGQLRETLQDRPLEINIPPELPLVKVDFTLIEQVLVNLLENAVKYSPPGSKIDIEVRREGKELQVAIADRGASIPEGERERVFEKFYRLQSPRHVSGTGLGLSICKGIIEAHGGRIWAEPRPGGGNVFTFSLPLDEQPPEQVPSARGGEEGDR
ncbi:sensor histidine kinase [Moorella sp. Hama-1]|uniref:sensor histidine kinase n=1 Tax=Moorella sp. Hama-1 TaxID=2138101 RepID=UPI000D6419EE|nr:sensor histidine kinase KdpD [Moorella sp. Hama-1]BCV21982.1 two-component sensor histidine kinase [Moorella sp. Hama-1]